MGHLGNYFNREISWLAFNRRVLEEASNPAHPLLERLRFLAISGSNLDEFFMVRVAGLKGQQLAGVEELSADGMTPAQQLEAVAGEAERLAVSQQQVWVDLASALSVVGIEVIAIDDADLEQARWLDNYFSEQIFPLLTPQAIDPAHPFPFIPNKGFSLVFDLKGTSDGKPMLALIMVPPILPRFLRIPGKSARYVETEALIRRHVWSLFPGRELLGQGAFRIIRDSDIEMEEEAEDLVRFFRSAIKRRRRGRVIRLEFEPGMSAELEAAVRTGLLATEALVSESSGFLGIGALDVLIDEDRPDLKFAVYTPRFPERFREHGGNYFAAIRANDILVHHPYETFDVVVDFVKQAASDPDVVAMKQTLYRTGKQSAIIRALAEASEAGKLVTAVVELKARFDEEQNLAWAEELERAGVQVVYGFVDFKTHAKVSMVVRREEDGYRTYCHFGTGNYHPANARIYTDLSLFTADPRAGRDATHLFNYITGYAEPENLELLSMSPHDLRLKLYWMIDREIANAVAGKPAMIWAKLNALVDPGIIDRLYAASQAGVQIDLIVRGVCCLRPGVSGMSENIRIKSIVGRFLEHGRICAFANGEPLPSRRADVFISSADWMPRSFNRRVEHLVRIEDQTVHAQVLDQVLLANLLDNQQSWHLLPDGSYQRTAGEGTAPFDLHSYLMGNPSLSGAALPTNPQAPSGIAADGCRNDPFHRV